MAYKPKWFFHPIFVFVFSIVALSLSLFLYIYWYVEARAGLRVLVSRYNLNPDQFLEAQTWVVILVISLLMAIILLSTIIIFVYGQKALRLYGLQHDFINNFTHELKTPVTSMKLYLETFLKHDLPREEQRKYIRYMLKDADRLSDNISMILNLAKIETKTYGGEFVNAELLETINQFRQQNAHLFPNCDIHIHNPSDGLFRYPINPPLFEMLLMNLIVNGFKYNASERPTMDIRFVPVKGSLHIRFEDNGIGVKKAEMRKIFKKFYRAERSEAAAAKGSGLGLYLVQNVARIHKGKVTVSAKEGEGGSVFTLILPLRTA